MADSRTLRLKFVIETRDSIAPSEFVSLFQCAEDFARSIAEQEVLGFLDYLEVPSQERLETVQRIHRVGRRIPTPAEVESIERGSWIVVVSLAGPALLYLLKSSVGPVVNEAWNDSRLRDLVYQFFRDRVFLGAREKIEAKASQSPRYGNLQVVEVEEQRRARSGDPTIEVRLERRDIIEVRVTDQQLIDEFLEGMG